MWGDMSGTERFLTTWLVVALIGLCCAGMFDLTADDLWLFFMVLPALLMALVFVGALTVVGATAAYVYWLRSKLTPR